MKTDTISDILGEAETQEELELLDEILKCFEEDEDEDEYLSDDGA